MTIDIFLDGDQIAQALKIPKKEIRRYVKEYGLPAFQSHPPTGPWRARPESLQKWAVEFEQRFLKKR
ncbi:hypothetical protein DESC_500141 [Desulfosarcina cetonica]|uniref:helix-turn-helix domain-containing protein n=1 Tax=Desulfosarcina cetonica TaxID=90730 RepID=UPI0006D0C15D|nr:helix-turn-helix domain-containing protein [Desulfosarcina cetonica]VTR66757.1 hypothetical protein DESC_500141 [Desulfosarcina cetonica]